MVAAVAACAVLSAPVFHASPAHRSARSADGVPIAYEVHGKGQRTLVFVHGWSCDRSHWRFQVDAFSKDHRVVVLDLAGHGDSGRGRSVWSIPNFAQDVAAVVDAVDARNVVLIGHSMGGPVVLEAALLRPARVIGVIGVDATTMFDGDTAAGLAPMIERMRTNFASETRAFARGMFRPASQPALVDSIVNGMAKAPPDVGIPALQGLETWGRDRQAAAASALSARVGLIVAGNKPAPAFVESGRGAALLVGVERMPDAGHFLMQEDPDGFNARLRALVNRVRLALPRFSAAPAGRDDEWREYAGDLGGKKYSPLTQIRADNIQDVQIAWTWPSPDREIQSSDPLMHSTRNEDTPLMVNDTLYTITPLGMVAALDPGTGKTHWLYDPQVYKNGKPANSGFIHRGLAYWSDGRAERILASTNDAFLISIDARTGVPDPKFGDAGRVDLTTGIRGAVRTKNFMGRRPVIAGNIAVVGSSIQDITPTKEMPPGYVKAYDIRTGKLAWTFHTVPLPGEFGYETWLENSADYSGNTNVWTGMSYDPELDYVYLPASGATHNTYGGHRPGDNLFSETLVCVEAKTGKRVWHFQLVHHGVWDYDIASQPVLGDITSNGRRIKAVIQVGKQGFAYVLDRKTGKPVWPIEERPVPQSTVPRERTSPTQPFPTRPPAFSLQGTTEGNLIDFTPALRKQALEQLQNFQHGPLYTPPSEKGTLILPGFQGGANWGGGAFDPDTGLFYVTSRLQSDVLRVAPGNPARSNFFYDSGGAAGGPNFNALQRIDGLHIFKPPYSKVTAIDMNKGDIAWTSPVGNGPRRHPLLKDLTVGPLGDEVRTMGVLVTKALLFVSVQRLDGPGRHTPPPWEQWGDADMWSRLLYVFDKNTGRELRVFHLDGESAAPPMTYMYRGRQYIVTAVGAGETSGLVALGLPDGRAAPVSSVTPGGPTRAQAPGSDGGGLYTKEQAGRGSAVYQARCASCHMPDLRGEGFAPALSGDTFAARWKGQPIGDLFAIVKGTMPADAPKSLRDDEYAEIVAYLLSMNGYPEGQKDLTTDVAKLRQLFFKKD